MDTVSSDDEKTAGASQYSRSATSRYVRLCLNNALLLKVALYCKRLFMSLTQSSSFPGPAPSEPCLLSSGSTMDDRLIQGTGYKEAWTVMASPGLSTCETWPSMDSPASARLRSDSCPRVIVISMARLKFEHGAKVRTRRVIDDEEGNTSGRNDRLRGHIGVRTNALNDG